MTEVHVLLLFNPTLTLTLSILERRNLTLGNFKLDLHNINESQT